MIGVLPPEAKPLISIRHPHQTDIEKTLHPLNPSPPLVCANHPNNTSWREIPRFRYGPNSRQWANFLSKHAPAWGTVTAESA